MPVIEPPVFSAAVFDIRKFGAQCGTNTLNTKAFQLAIAECSRNGGGTVLAPPGVWLTGAIHLRGNVRLHLEEGSIIRFSDRAHDYLPVVFTRWEGVECYNYSPLVYAHECNNIAITGRGVLEGQGDSWWGWKKLQQAAVTKLYNAEHDKIPVKDRVFGREQDALRPQFFQPINCKNVLVEGVTFKFGPFWTIHPVYCENVMVRNVSVITSGEGKRGVNADGLNPDSCRNVLIEGCCFNTGDDCVAINAGMNEDGWRVGKPCENVLIRHCRMGEGHGAVVIGSGMSGGARNICAYDCQCSGTDRGIRLKSMRGRGGIVENVWFDNFDMQDMRYEAIVIDMFYGASSSLPLSDALPSFRNINISNVRCGRAKKAVLLRGLPEKPLQQIALEDVHICAEEGMSVQDVENLTVKNASIA